MFPQKLSEKSPYELFCVQETIQYCNKQLRSSKFKNLKPKEKSVDKSDAKVLKTQRKEIMKKKFTKCIQLKENHSNKSEMN